MNYERNAKTCMQTSSKAYIGKSNGIKEDIKNIRMIILLIAAEHVIQTHGLRYLEYLEYFFKKLWSICLVYKVN